MAEKKVTKYAGKVSDGGLGLAGVISFAKIDLEEQKAGKNGTKCAVDMN